MYLTIQAACRAAIRAHTKEKRYHVIFKEVGLYRVKPIDEIEEIDQRAIYGWTYSVWHFDLHDEKTFPELRKKFPMGDVAKVRKQFYKNEGYYNPERIGLKLRNKYSSKEICEIIMTGQNL